MKWIKALFTNLWKLYVGVVFSITAILLYPFFLVVLALPDGRKRSFKLFVFWSRLMSFFCLYPTRQNKKIDNEGKPFVLIANHTSYLDIFLMFSQFPDHPFLFLGKSEILSYPIISTYFKNLNIPVDRNNKSQAGQAFVRAKNAIEEGFSICIFPEGGIPDLPAPKMARFKDGPFLMAQKTGVPVVSVTLQNNYKLFSDPSAIFGPARPGISYAFVHEKVYVDETNIKEAKKKCFELIESKLK
jgi:1-acyl-sn-glycerol-3-phosphate acyltransferase